MQSRPSGFIDTAVAYAISAFQYLVLSKDGQGINDAASVYASRKLEAERAKGKAYYLSDNLTRWWSSMRLFSVDTSKLSTQSIQHISSGEDEPKRYTFAPIEDVVDLPQGSPMSWFFAQDKVALDGRKLLARLMHDRPVSVEELESLDPDLLQQLGNPVTLKRFDLLRQRTANRVYADLAKMESIPCLYQWLHQLNLELISDHVLGLPSIPEYTHTVLDNIEYAIVHESPSFNTFGYRWNLTPSQRRFTAAKQAFSELSQELVHTNRVAILNGTGYLSQLLQQESARFEITKEEALDHPEIKRTLYAAAAGSLLAGGALSTTITMALLHFDNDMLQRLTDGDLADSNESYLDIFFREALRYSSSIAHNSRYATHDKQITDADGKEITIAKDTIIFLDHRRSNQSRENWGDPENFRPERFQDEKTPKLNSNRFAPFSLGPRMCAGRQVAEVIFKQVISCFIEKQIYVNPIDPVLKQLNSPYWSNEDFMTRPIPGKMISVALVKSDIQHSMLKRL